MKKFSIALVLLMLASLACNFSLPSGKSAPVASSSVLYSDDFSNVNSGWDRVTKDYKITDYDGNGAYRIWVDRAQFDVWSTPYQNFDGDVIVEADATKVGGPDDNDFGVICRYTEDTTAQTFSFYYFIISSDGYAVIGRVLNGQQQWISSDAMQSSTAINTGAATNHIRADCVGSTLTLYVNGQKVTSVADTNLAATGDAGLMAGTFDTTGVDMLFDNFTVSRP
jgi:hypothetical protein